ncbi:hypothetical protein KP509_18G051500 [Ceratopteris richardii]|nr:hypothetical protein KP509_18G051500 [Ceratopteris richardii]
MKVYVKPHANDIWTVGSRKNVKNSKGRNPEGAANLSVIDVSLKAETKGQLSKGKNGAGKAKKLGKGVPLAEAIEGKMIISRGSPCNCQATRHPLVTNCLSCGRIVCEQEGEGPCNFCGALVLKEGSTYAGLERCAGPKSDSEVAARAFKDRLVEYGRTSSQRTTVIDDQSDYFQIDDNAWLSEEEKQAIMKRQEEARLAEEARKKNVVVTIDLLGRKVIMADDTENSPEISSSILNAGPAAQRHDNLRIKPNPSVVENPVFLNLQQQRHAGVAVENIHSGRKPKALHSKSLFRGTGRVQHDDPFESVFEEKYSEENNGNLANTKWMTPKIKDNSNLCSFDDEDCLQDESKEITVFDICPPQTSNRVSLSPSILAQKQAERSRKMEDSSSVLMPGLILLKGWLNQNNQVEIVKRCRDLGVGPGGFYQPSYNYGNRMHLYMMCLGMHWEPLTKSYEMKRSIDGATPPSIPPLFQDLVANCLDDARHMYEDAIKGPDKGRKIMDLVPEMHPSICIVNFYERSGRLGMHQDKDESQESLRQGLPVVSFSIGDSAEFIYGLDRDESSAQTIVLESGDALIFGGPSRMVYHGIVSVIPRTAPSSLIEKTNLRPGRLNLTFRQM